MIQTEEWLSWLKVKPDSVGLETNKLLQTCLQGCFSGVAEGDHDVVVRFESTPSLFGYNVSIWKNG